LITIKDIIGFSAIIIMLKLAKDKIIKQEKLNKQNEKMRKKYTGV